MENQELINKWLSLEGEAANAFRSLRIDALAMPDLFLGIDTLTRRCLILRLPVNYVPDFQSSVKQNLSLELFAESKWIVLTLLDDQYFDLFNDLILSIYNKIWNLDDSTVYVSELLKTYYKWSEFFTDNMGNGLSDEEIKGLFGELVILNQILKNTDSHNLNVVMNSWKGPYGTGHDFEDDTIDIEVKTKNFGAALVKISSEYQLQEDPGKDLDLSIVNVHVDPLHGISLKDMFILIRNYVMERLADYTILLKAISQKGLTLKNLSDYDHLKFTTVSIVTYDCKQEGFPRLIRSALPDTINSVSYKLNINLLTSYIKYEITL